MLSKINNPVFRIFMLIFFALSMETSISIAQCNQSLNINVTVQQPCNNDGILTANVLNGTPPYTFIWKNYLDPNFTANTQIVNNVKPGYYSVDVFDANGLCGSDKEIGVFAPFTFQWTTTPANCPSVDGSAEITSVSGGTIPYTYLWSNGATTQKIENVEAGAYFVTITDAVGCTTETSGIGEQRDSVGIEITQLNNLVIQINVTPATCALNSGQLSVDVVSGGTSPFTYHWKNFQTFQTWNTQTLTNIPGNNYYEVIVTDADGCFIKQYAELPKTPSFTVNIVNTKENCDRNDGTITGVANGGNPPYNWSWNNGMTGAQLTGLNSDSYYATITDNNGCQEAGYQYVPTFTPLILNPVMTDDICDQGTGKIKVEVSFGQPPYSFSWNTGSTQNEISNLKEGYYQVLVSDINGCTTNGYYYLRNNPTYVVQALITNTKCMGTKGNINLVITGGTAPFSFVWSNGQSTEDISGLDPGYYLCTITDASGCSTISGSFVNTEVQIYPWLYETPASCELSDGTVYLNVNGSFPPFTFNWSNGTTNQNLTSAPSGNYKVTITDAIGCFVEKSFFLSKSSGNLKVNLNVTPASCIFEIDGEAEAVVTGGTPPFTYLWGTGGTSNAVSNLPAYFGMGVKITDSNGCISQDFVPSIGFNNYDCAAVVRGKVLLDANTNCVEDSGENGLENVLVACLPTVQGFTKTNALGNYQYFVPKDQSYVITQHPDYLNPVCPSASIITPTLSAGQISDNHNFYDTPYEVNDLKVSMNYLIPPRPGFDFELHVLVSNAGLYKTTGEVKVKFDPGVTYISGASSIDLSNYEATLDFTDLPAFTGEQRFVLRFSTPATTALGTRQKYVAHAYPDVNDVRKIDNEEKLDIEVVGSYDPNDIRVKVIGGFLTDCLQDRDSILQYTIRFQNTGNYPASFVTIKNKLDENLDITTLRTGASSHTNRFQFLPDGNLVFMFDPINLPDSTRDEKNSHGFVTYYIQPKKEAPNSDVIPNKAEIYFDFNDAIVTNTVNLYLCRTSRSTEENFAGIIEIFPNPVEDKINVKLETNEKIKGRFLITNILGQTCKLIDYQHDGGVATISIPVHELVCGSYMITFIGNQKLPSMTFFKSSSY